MKRPATPTASLESGVILVNVLSVLALSSAVMVAILTLQDVSIERSTGFIDAGAATAYALGGETSAIVALRRDAMESPEVDHYREAWSATQESGAAIQGGSFRLVIADEQGRFNLNNILTDGLVAQDVLKSLMATLRAPPETATAISDFILAREGLSDIAELRDAGFDEKFLVALKQVACVLPEATDVNLNSVSEQLLAAMLQNRASAKLLISRRERQGFLAPSDLATARIVMPVRASFRSDYFVVRTDVEYGTVTQSLESRLHRVINGGQPAVVVWSRKRNAAAG